jgi:hypothetical protein
VNGRHYTGLDLGRVSELLRRVSVIIAAVTQFAGMRPKISGHARNTFQESAPGSDNKRVPAVTRNRFCKAR